MVTDKKDITEDIIGEQEQKQTGTKLETRTGGSNTETGYQIETTESQTGMKRR